MFADRVACCLLASHVEYGPRALLRLEKDGTDGQTDGRTPDRYFTLIARRDQHNKAMAIQFNSIQFNSMCKI